MSLNTPLPEEKRTKLDSGAPGSRGADSRGAAAVRSFAQAERLLQIAFVLPCAMLLCWGAGWWLDQHFHTKWMTPTGLVLGIIAGMVSAIRLALAIGNSPKGSK